MIIHAEKKILIIPEICLFSDKTNTNLENIFEKIKSIEDRFGSYRKRTIEYQVTVCPDVKGAGTDTKVFLKIFGVMSNSDEIELSSLTSLNKFDRGQVFILNNFKFNNEEIKLKYYNLE